MSGWGEEEVHEEVAEFFISYMCPVNGVAAEQRGCALGKAGDSCGREALGKHFLDHSQPVAEAAPAEDNQKFPPPVHFCIQICTNMDKTFLHIRGSFFHEEREIWSQCHSKNITVSYWALY